MLTYEEKEKLTELRDAFELLRRNADLIPDALETTHRTIQQLIMRDVIVEAIQHWAKVFNDKERLRYDDRNHATVRICDRIVREVDDLDCLPYI